MLTFTSSLLALLLLFILFAFLSILSPRVLTSLLDILTPPPLRSLNSIPTPSPLCHITPLYMHYIRHSKRENATIEAAHQKLGPVIRLGPREISVNCVKGGIREVYGGGYEKSCWYAFFGNFGVPNMFSTISHKPHAHRKRMLSNIYSKSTILSSAPLHTQTSNIIYNRFLPYLFSTLPENSDSGILNIFPLLNATTMDITTAYIFGPSSGSDFIRKPEKLDRFLHIYACRFGFTFFPQELPQLTEGARKWLGVRLYPEFVDEANREIEAWTRGMCQSAERVLGEKETRNVRVEDVPVVYSQLSAALEKERKKNGDDVEKVPDPVNVIASELLDHLAAGFETSGITLTYLVYELSRHPDIQAKLRSELLTLAPAIVPSPAPGLPDAKDIDTLPFLHAVIWETLRLHSAIPGPQPRVTPASGCQLGPPDSTTYWIPGGVRVSASAGVLHANDEVFERADQWRPERWLGDVEEERRKEMDRWFWAFGSGGRMCVGRHLALYQMKYILAAIYSNFKTTVIDDAGIEQSDAYTAPPKSDKLMIRLECVKDE
ncbi:cytochrome P450 monooxygenase-like protein [Delitschia confertaspora ATCC 74209]|uniref:Cytochrome P450 monooxygenase-like protein n=1 Tax=Delitschia confertaspora ATCC 74209 TaxID=1513339 RepID=A0A9P4JRE1_9PLEO|nr:cytochrome P450 monooxygenase-like protein [Delitschia confertaspora ATCC 74209]